MEELGLRSYLVHLFQGFPVGLRIQQEWSPSRDQIRGHKNEVKVPSNARYGNWCDLVEQDLRQPIDRAGD